MGIGDRGIKRSAFENGAVSGLSRWQNATSSAGFHRGGVAFSSMGIAGVGSVALPRQYVDVKGHRSQQQQQHHSLLFTDHYLDRVPLSRAASTTLLTNQQFNGPVFDRQSQFVVRDPALNFKPAMIRRAQSMNDLRFPDAFFTSGLNWPLQRGLNGIQRPFNYLIQMPDQERNRVSIGAESDEIQRSYKDVAL